MRLKEFLLGKRLHSGGEGQERLSNVTALAVLSSDALSSVAYATEEILLVLVLGMLSVSFALPLALAIIALLGIIVFSYRQTILAYPQGASAYIVARENLGTLPSLIAGASLLIDYILTVAVSVAAGVAALTSALPFIQSHKILLALVFVLLLSLGNLRGVREAGRLFRTPTLFFIASMFLLVGWGGYQWFAGKLAAPGVLAGVGANIGDFSQLLTMALAFKLLHAFSSGCTALTGIEAVSDGVKVFREPASFNARKTLAWMAGILATIFLGITFLAVNLNIRPQIGETVLSQLTRSVVGGGAVYYFIQASTMAILVMAANTAFADFPRLAQFIARDYFLPRYFTTRGGRLVFSNGIIILAFVSMVLLILFDADTHSIIPLYMVGVFTSFTLSQVGMAKKNFRSEEWNVRFRAIVSSAGAVITLMVLAIVLSTKFVHGAWITFTLIPCAILFFRVVKRHYDKREQDVQEFVTADSAKEWKQAINRASRDHRRLKAVMEAEDLKFSLRRSFIIPVSQINEAVVMAVFDALTEPTRHHVVVFHVALDDDDAARARAEWQKVAVERLGVPPELEFKVVMDEYRDIVGAVEREVWAQKQHLGADKIYVKVPHIDYPSVLDYILTANHPLRVALALRRLFERRTKRGLRKSLQKGEVVFRQEIEVDLVSYAVPYSSSFVPLLKEEVMSTAASIIDFIRRRAPRTR